MPPVGDVPSMFRSIMMFQGPQEIHITRSRKDEHREDSYEVRKTELAEALGSLEDTGSLVLMDQYLRSLEEEDETIRP
jgi:hypothetical protein